MKRFYLLLTAILLITFTAPAFSYERWVGYAFGYNINALDSHGDLVWCATDKGVFSFDINTGKESRYQQEDGLLEDMSLHITTSSDGDVWVLSESGTSYITKPCQPTYCCCTPGIVYYITVQYSSEMAAFGWLFQGKYRR